MSAKLALAALAASAAVAATTLPPAQPPAAAANATAPANAAAGPPPIETPANPNGGHSATLSVSDCQARFADVGAPLHRGADAASQQILVCRTGYFLSANTTTRDPDWVMEHLTPQILTGSAKRSPSFFTDTALPASDQVTPADYTSTGFDRGHQAPAGDAEYDQGVEDQTFNMSNMGPQVGIGMNRGAWAYLEETVRGWVLCGGRPDIYVMTGPIYDPNASHPLLPKGQTAQAGKTYPQVPTAYYKIIYDRGSQHAVGFVLPNKNIGSTIKLQDYVQPITNIEAQTGLNFFTALDIRTQGLLENQAGVAWAHVASCKATAES